MFADSTLQSGANLKKMADNNNIEIQITILTFR
jgi:hypothetical protein